MRIAGITLERSRYPVIEGREDLASPCWKATARWLYLDADWNTRFPWGTSLCVRVRRHDPEAATAPGFTLDVNAPLGEPNRLYLWGGPAWCARISLPQLRTRELTGEEYHGVPVYREVPRWPPHLPDGWRHAITITRRHRDG